MSMLNHKWEYFEVGKCRAEWIGLPDGQIIDWTDMCGFSLMIFWNKPSREELLSVSARRYFEVAFKEIENVGFFAFKFGNCEWCDCAFSPNIYDKIPKFEEIEKGKSYALHIMVIDTSNGELKYLRSLALGRDFADYIRTWALQSLDKNISKRYYNKAVDEAYKKFPMPDDIARNADIKWVFPHGEERNLTLEEKQ